MACTFLGRVTGKTGDTKVDSHEKAPYFIHRSNQDGTYEAICSQCFRTVAMQSEQAELGRFEDSHHCAEQQASRPKPSADQA